MCRGFTQPNGEYHTMTDREREFAALGFEYAEGIEQANRVIIPSTGREIRRTKTGKWEAQPWNDNYWKSFADVLDAIRFATPPRPTPRETTLDRGLIELGQPEHNKSRYGSDGADWTLRGMLADVFRDADRTEEADLLASRRHILIQEGRIVLGEWELMPVRDALHEVWQALGLFPELGGVARGVSWMSAGENHTGVFHPAYSDTPSHPIFIAFNIQLPEMLSRHLAEIVICAAFDLERNAIAWHEYRARFAAEYPQLLDALHQLESVIVQECPATPRRKRGKA